MMFFYVHFNKAVDKDILEKIMKTLAVEEEQIEERSQYNLIINGNLSLLLLMINANPPLSCPQRR